ncbi:hypothetical protein WCE00_13845 [Acinetobacter haemolyticus]|uniref:Uncharacterized protein n=1 Tax=Acinetobacter haemolyticus TaxID=29430 RepID=A0A2K8Q172_ACIHA|nr:hypothetical protein [Acinetobacter haemolyticus]ATZ68709.1 hypothetical protein BSR56_00665 [Acinetobacter haemolyticus]NAR17508.1 hypothetical protein [Acinetobacter haemolyticus]NAR37047.1 hypothetical protein [Acinetobacter haemolyticus]NAR63515.1 hypothetical protein [Acinetobacter haemolyticus]QHI11687.1 hypothetical protein AhaeAN59_00905 [Acinetobacter haemolyticus]
MELVEIEPYFWELYKDSEGMYLNVIINMSAVSWEKMICLDEEATQNYLTQGKKFIVSLAKRIENSQFRKDYEKFYSYPEVSMDQRNQMSDALLVSKIYNP